VVTFRVCGALFNLYPLEDRVLLTHRRHFDCDLAALVRHNILQAKLGGAAQFAGSSRRVPRLADNFTENRRFKGEDLR
jgi:hypothetical protein